MPATVREVLGEDPLTSRDEVETYVERLLHRMAGTVEKLGEKFPEPEQQNRARELLPAGLDQLRNSLQGDIPAGE